MYSRDYLCVCDVCIRETISASHLSPHTIYVFASLCLCTSAYMCVHCIHDLTHLHVVYTPHTTQHTYMSCIHHTTHLHVVYTPHTAYVTYRHFARSLKRPWKRCVNSKKRAPPTLMARRRGWVVCSRRFLPKMSSRTSETATLRVMSAQQTAVC